MIQKAATDLHVVLVIKFAVLSLNPVLSPLLQSSMLWIVHIQDIVGCLLNVVEESRVPVVESVPNLRKDLMISNIQ